MRKEINNFVLIIGAAKSGTTSLFNYLSEHPQIAPSLKKETHFFSKSKVYSNGFDYYQNLWDWNHNVHKIALEASPSYTRVTNLNYLNAAKNIQETQKATQSNFKFIYIVRNPIDRIESHYTHIQAWQCEPHKKSLSQEIDSEIIDVSKYAMQIEEYYQRFHSNNILLLNFEDLKIEPLKVIKEVCQFLEVDSNYEFQGLNTIYNRNSTRTKINIPNWHLIRKTELIKRTIKLIPNRARKVFYKIFGSKVEEHAKLSLEQKIFVLKELQDDLIRLRINYGVDTRKWKIDYYFIRK